MEFILGMIIIVGSVFLYFLPALVGSWRGAKNALGITLLNLFLGWMGLGWVIALIWSVCAECEEKKEAESKAPNLFGGGSSGWED